MDANLAAIVDLLEQWSAGQVASEHAASQQIIDGLHAQLSAALTQHDTDVALIEQLRARIAELEAQVPPPPEPPPTPEPPPPAPVWAGLLYGANDSHWSSLASQVPGMQVRRSYAGTWPAVPTARMQEDWRAGRVPYVSFSDTSPSDANLATFFKACTGKAIVTPVHEVDNGKMTAAAYVALLKRVHAAKEANATHPEQVLVGPTLMGWTFHTTAYRQWLVPGSMDFIGADPYSFWRPAGSPPDPKTGTLGMKRDLAWILGDLPTYAKSLGLPITIGEYGCHPDPADPGFRAAWLRAQDAYLRASGCIAACYFHAPYGESGPWWLDRFHTFTADMTARAAGAPDPDSVTAFKSLIR